MINRLSRWSLAQEIVSQIQLIGSTGHQTMTTKTSYLPMLVLDINTIPGHHEPLDQLDSLLGELVDLGTEIVMQGDIS